MSDHHSIKGIAAYAVTKTTLLGLTKALSHELAKDNIRVNAIAPGIIKTKMSEAVSGAISPCPLSSHLTVDRDTCICIKFAQKNNKCGAKIITDRMHRGRY